MSDIAAELLGAGERELAQSQSEKKNYAERLSRELAQLFANSLRADFPGIYPDVAGKGHESRARTSKGFKKLDVNYSTPELGLGLGVSIKTLNFADAKSARFTKNFTRIDNELRAEAKDYHHRQPWSVLVAVIFLPAEAALDGRKTGDAPSSFGQAVKIFRGRGGRTNPRNEEELFEKVYLGLYSLDQENFGSVKFVDTDTAPPRHGPPTRGVMNLPGLLDAIKSTYDARNAPHFEWDRNSEI